MWHILGAGSIGCLFSTHLTRANLPHRLLFRQPQKLALLTQAGGIHYTSPAGESDFFPAHGELLKDTSPISQLLICTKAFQAEAAFNAIKQRLAPNAEVILLHNGMGPQQHLASEYPDVHIWAATTTEGAHLALSDTAFQLTHAGYGETRYGPLNHSPSHSILPAPLFQLTNPILPWLWRKLAINAAINPLTALYGCRNGALLNLPGARQKMVQICAEVTDVAAACNIDLQTPLFDSACAVTKATAANYSSMLQDIQQQHPSEIDQITGFICQKAQTLGLSTPANLSILKRIRQISAKVTPVNAQ